MCFKISTAAGVVAQFITDLLDILDLMDTLDDLSSIAQPVQYVQLVQKVCGGLCNNATQQRRFNDERSKSLLRVID